MPQNANEHKHSTGHNRSISPVQELRFLDAIMADHELPMTARVVGHRLVRWTNGDEAHRFNGYAWAGREKLAEWIGRDSCSTITTATNALKARGWIIVKRRPNASSLIRPNWDRMSQQLGEMPEDQKTELPEDKLSVHPDLQKSGPYSADLDSADHDRSINPERSASGMSDSSFRGSASGADRHEKPRPYKQTKADADQTFERLERMPWKTEADDPAFDPTDKAGPSARIHWHRLLKESIAAWRIELAAGKFMQELPESQRPCLAGFLGRYARQCIDPEEWLFIPDDAEESQSGFANDNEKLDRASGEG